MLPAGLAGWVGVCGRVKLGLVHTTSCDVDLTFVNHSTQTAETRIVCLGIQTIKYKYSCRK